MSLGVGAHFWCTCVESVGWPGCFWVIPEADAGQNSW